MAIISSSSIGGRERAASGAEAAVRTLVDDEMTASAAELARGSRAAEGAGPVFWRLGAGSWVAWLAAGSAISSWLRFWAPVSAAGVGSDMMGQAVVRPRNGLGVRH